MYEKTALLAIGYLISVSKERNESFLFVRPMTLTDANLNQRIANPFYFSNILYIVYFNMVHFNMVARLVFSH